MNAELWSLHPDQYYLTRTKSPLLTHREVVRMFISVKKKEETFFFPIILLTNCSAVHPHSIFSRTE